MTMKVQRGYKLTNDEAYVSLRGLWRCEDCHALVEAKISPVECQEEGCEGEMYVAPQSAR